MSWPFREPPSPAGFPIPNRRHLVFFRALLLGVGALLGFAVGGCGVSEPPATAPTAARSHLVVKLAEGCRLEGAADGFSHLVFADGRTFAVSSGLPAGTRFEYRVPELAEAPPGSLSESEADLSRFVQIVFPAVHEAAGSLTVVRAWPCVEAVELSPEIGLPSTR